MRTSKHTPTPWQVHQSHLYGNEKQLIAQFCGNNLKPDMDFALRACNAYDDLVEALKDAYEVVPPDCTNTLHKIEAALVKVEDGANDIIITSKGKEKLR